MNMGNKNRWMKTIIRPLHDGKFVLEVEGEDKQELEDLDDLLDALVEQFED